MGNLPVLQEDIWQSLFLGKAETLMILSMDLFCFYQAALVWEATEVRIQKDSKVTGPRSQMKYWKGEAVPASKQLLAGVLQCILKG